MADDEDTSVDRGGLVGAAKRLARTLAGTFRNRTELFIVELQEEGIRFVGALLLVAFTLLFSGLALIMGMFAVLLAAGEEHRLLAAVIMTGALLACAAGAALWLAHLLKHWSAFPGTRAELRKDCEWIGSTTSER